MGLKILVTHGNKMAVGGILAYNQYDVKGATDIVVRNRDGAVLLVMEVKTEESFGRHNWYRDHRAAQVITPLYHFNAPVFLINNKHWKLFYENNERNAIYTYPTKIHRTNPFLNSLMLFPVGYELIKAIIICLSAKRAEDKPVLSFAASSNELPLSPEEERKIPDSCEKPTKRIRTESRPIPSFQFINDKGELETVHARLYEEDDVNGLDWHQTIEKTEDKENTLKVVDNVGDERSIA
jgi:hypothetical protein